MTYIFEDYELDSRRHELRRSGEILAIERQVFALLELLIENRDRVVTKEEIHRVVWKGRIVSDAAVNSRIRSARIAIGDDGKSQRLIKTFYGLGFRFLGQVDTLREDGSISLVEDSPQPKVDSTPADLSPTEPTLDASSPADSSPANPSPTDSSPANPSPTDSSPANPSPTDSPPADSSPADSIRADSTDGVTPGAAGSVLINALGKRVLFVLSGLLVIGIVITMTWTLWQSDSTHAIKVADSQSLETPSSRSPQASVAVLPFVDMSEFQDQKHLADGVAEEILNVLARVEGLKVSSRTSAFVFRDHNTKLTDVGKALGVGHILEGSIRKSGETVRVTVQLINTESDSHVWSNTYDHQLSAENLLRVQDDIARSVVSEIATSLNLKESDVSPRIESLESYEAHLRGLQFLRRKEPKSLQLAVESFDEAIAQDLKYAPAYAGLARAHMLATFYAGKTRKEVIPLVRNYVARAMELAPDNPEVLYAAARFAQMESRHEDVLKLTEEAIRINPNYAPAYGMRAGVLPVLGRHDDALAAYQEAVSLDPLAPGLLGNYAWLQMLLGDIDDAQATAQDNIKWNPTSPDALNLLGVLQIQTADYANAEKNLRRSHTTNPDGFGAQEQLVGLYMNIGLEDHADSIAHYPTQKARVLALRGDIGGARQLMLTHESDFGIQEVSYLTNDFALSHQRNLRTVTEALLPRGIGPLERHGLHLIELFYVFNQMNDPAAEQLLALSTQYFAEKQPEDFIYWQDHLGGAGYHLLQDQIEEAFRWLDKAIDQGHAFLVLDKRPLFAPLTQHTDYKSRLQRMQDNAERHRASILGFDQDTHR